MSGVLPESSLDKHFKPDSGTILQIFGLSARKLLSATNIMFLVAGIYFLTVAGLGEGSVYSAIGTLLCFVAAGLAIRKDLIVAAPFRTATAAFSAVVFLGQIVADTTSTSGANVYTIGSAVINSTLFVLFVGVLLSASRDMMRAPSSEEDEKEEKKESKRLTYQV